MDVTQTTPVAVHKQTECWQPAPSARVEEDLDVRKPLLVVLSKLHSTLVLDDCRRFAVISSTHGCTLLSTDWWISREQFVVIAWMYDLYNRGINCSVSCIYLGVIRTPLL
jgi:hypothetical protein